MSASEVDQSKTTWIFEVRAQAVALVGAMCGWTVRRLAGRLTPLAGAGRVAVG